MSLPLDLDEYQEKDLREEVRRREEARATGRCDYCGRPAGSEPVCKFPGRHGKR